MSRDPFGFRRATATRKSEPPTSTILPSGWSAAPNADSRSPPKSITRLPPGPNVVSGAPLLRRRMTQNEVAPAPPPPASTILPFGCTSTASAASLPPKVIVFLPLPSKVVSRSPAAMA